MLNEVYEKHLLNKGKTKGPLGGVIMKINTITPSAIYNKPIKANVSFKDSENTMPATNPDVPQFKQASSKLKPSKLSSFFNKLVGMFSKDSKDAGIYNQQGLEQYVSQRVFLI